eukprot:COSAG01_NODE_18134_length_1098_cov_2.443443_1_plen_150_part_01
MARLRSTARACTTQVSIMGNCGLWFGSFLGGAIADTRGPRAAMTAGAALFLVGYGGIYLGLSHAVSALRHWQAVAALWLCSGLGSGFVYNATIFTTSQNFGRAGRAKVIGMLATLFGASSTVWSTAYSACLGGHARYAVGSGGASGGGFD